MMKRSIGSLLALLTPFALTFCGDKTNQNLVVPTLNGNVAILDECDSASFNAAVGAGTCTRAGSVTFSAFTAEFTATGAVAAWRFDPSTMTLPLGRTITATNRGGEIHTFTAVAAFGGGINPALNGTLAEAPECAAITDADKIAPGATFTTTPLASSGTHLYQCCIHPWMHETVSVP